MTTCAHRRTKCEPLKFADGREHIVVHCLERDCGQWLRQADKPRAKQAADEKALVKRKKKQTRKDDRPWIDRGLSFREMGIDDEWTARGGVLMRGELTDVLVILTTLPQANSANFRGRVYAWFEREPDVVERLLRETEARKLAPVLAAEHPEGWG